MTAITEDYVSFETAKLLKEKGFDARCPMIYTVDGEMLYTDVKHHNMYAVTNKQLEYYTDIIAPTQAMAMKWLREAYKIFICPLFIDDSNCYGYTIESLATKKYLATSGSTSYESYEQAAEAALKYSLENLIK